MKELSIEEKAKRYDEAIERARNWYIDCQLNFKKALEELFPELKESEDGRIRKALITYFKNLSDVYSLEPLEINPKEAIAWLEKQGEKASDKIVEKAKNEKQRVLLTETNGNANIDWDARSLKDVRALLEHGLDYITKLEKQGEQKPADKVELKLKVGNWYQCTKDFFGKGVTFDRNTAYYCAKEGCLQDEYGCHIAIVKDLYDNFKLWTIEDAKDGDVLACNEEILLFKSYSVQNRISLYCWYNGQTNNFHSKGVNDALLTTTTRNKICPATKKQRDTLMEAMADAGYAFDFEKKELKELKKIEQNSIEPDNLIEESYQQQADDLIDMVTEKPVWSKEDEVIKKSLITLLQHFCKGYRVPGLDFPVSYKDMLAWFEKQYEQFHPQPDLASIRSEEDKKILKALRKSGR